jgi:hypothetical protein
MPIPTGTAAISFSQLRDEMNIGTGGAYPSAATPTAPQGTALSLNDATVRVKITDTVQNAQLSLSSLRGNTYRRFTIAANAVNYDIRAAMGAAPIGWNGTSKASADVVVNGGVVVGTPNTGAYAMDTGAAGWPAPSHIYVENNGYIIGHGGNGGAGGPVPGPDVGGAGGPALLARRAMTLVNNGTVGGGGGGGGGAPGTTTTTTSPPPQPPTSPSFPGTPSPITTTRRYAGGSGGGGRTGTSATSGGAAASYPGPNNTNSSAGNPGSFSAAGTGSGGAGPAGNGGPGGNWGTAGSPGSPGVQAGGAAGISVQGWSNVTKPTGSTGISGPTTG